MIKKTIGVLTIGQSPRTDIVPSFQAILGDDVCIKEAGGLDRLTEQEIANVYPDEGDTVYISRLRDGSSVKMGKSKILPLLQKEINELEKEASIIIVLCTGELQALSSNKTMIFPDAILKNIVAATLQLGTLGLIIPLEEQKEKMLQRWKNFPVFVEVASPYAKSDVEQAAKKLKEKGASLIVLSCMGYNERHKEEAIQGSSLPVLLPKTLIAKIASEYL
ncbi:AroM family protein [Ornithinibacillus sp. 4-3]|uniref:AroM family protein n=1 Tax=Ornithinibacillus sp. 4-3 TaxID=3231488 RepID=A0AB39HPH9_9BACI